MFEGLRYRKFGRKQHYVRCFGAFPVTKNPQVFVFGSIYQGAILVPFFEPLPFESQSKPGIKMVKADSRNYYFGWDCPLLTFIYPGFEQVAQLAVGQKWVNPGKWNQGLNRWSPRGLILTHPFEVQRSRPIGQAAPRGALHQPRGRSRHGRVVSALGQRGKHRSEALRWAGERVGRVVLACWTYGS